MARRNILDNSNPDTVEELSLSYDAAVALLKASRNRTFFLRVRIDALVKADASKVFLLTGHVPVNLPTALKVIDDAYGARFRVEANVSLSVHRSCIFIG